MIGHSTYSRGYDMTLVSNTKIYKVSTSNWGDAELLSLILVAIGVRE